MGNFASDIRFALRTMRINPGFTAIAVAALALGIGANTAIFTVVNAVLLQPLPYPHSERIMRLGRKFNGNNVGSSNSIPKYMVWRQNHVFESMTLYGQSGAGLNLGSGDRPDEVKSLRASEGYFRVFGVSPIIGRTFTEAEDLPGGPNVAVISYSLWHSHFDGDPQIVGRGILLNKQPYTVIGILPKGFQSEPEGVDVWLPQQADPNSTNQGHYLAAAGRLKPGVSLETANAEMRVVGERFRKAYPEWMNKGESVAAVPLQEALVGDVKPALLILLGAVTLVLLIACANVANLLLARAAVRQRELAIRAAIGASRGRMFRQLLTESVLLALVGGVCGFVLGAWGVRALLLMVPGNIPRLTDANGVAQAPSLDWRVAAFTIGVAALTGILFGLFPSLHTSNPNLASTLKESASRSGTGLRQNWARSILVVSEIGLSLILLVGAALLIRTFVGLRSVNPGIDAHNVLTVQTSMAGGTYDSTAKVANFSTQVLRRVESLPGVEAAASMIVLPIENGVDLPFNIAGKPPTKGDLYNGDEQWRSVTPHYFQVFKIPLLRGRAFGETDVANSAHVVIINQHMAKQYWKNEDPIGQVITIGKGLGPQFDDPPRQIIAVVGDVYETGLGNGAVGVMYIPQSQAPEGITALANSVIPLCWAVRTNAEPMNMHNAVEREFHSVDGLLTLSQTRTMEQVIAKSVSRQDFNMLLLTIFAGIALLLAAIGIYGLMSYSVEQRTQEMGIRMALGAQQSDMLKLIVRHGLTLAAAGIVLGLLAAFGLTRLLGSLLFGVKSWDPLAFGVVAAVLMMVATVSTYIPARRAAAVDPSDALRYQ